MSRDDKDATRQVNPAARRDAPHEPTPADEEAAAAHPEKVRPTQGHELNPRDQAGIDE
jgi:hypothetical protein